MMYMGSSHPFAPRQSRHSSSSTATYASPSDGRRAIFRKENQFIDRYGSKLHAYDRDKAPYPCSFDRDVMEVQCLDNALVVATKGFPAFSDLQSPPKRCLDIGTGLGLWVVSAAKTWTETTFVGLDMVNIQIPHKTLDPDIADRIEWVHCNILRNRLPFDDDEFDHVHIQGLALGIPENKWFDIYEEVRRVMKPGATIEHCEEDAIFPTLPRWYTDPLRAHARTLSTAAPGSIQQRLTYPPTSETAPLSHEHELLETLYDEVWSSRFINPTPSSIIPGYFGAVFRHVQAPPVLDFLPPPFAPFAPIPGAQSSPLRPPSLPNGSTHVPNGTSLNGNGIHRPHEEVSHSKDETDRSDTEHSSDMPPSPSVSPTLLSSTENSPKEDMSPLPLSPSSQKKALSDVPASFQDSEDESLLSGHSRSDSQSSGSTTYQSTHSMIPSPGVQPLEDTTTLNSDGAVDVLATDRAQSLDEQTRYMQLYRVVTSVLSTKEAMWDELLVRVNKKDPELMKYGWQDEDYTEQGSRERFEHAIEQYQSDMRTRISLWNCAVLNGWALPKRDPPTRAELLEEMLLRHEILEAQRFAKAQAEPPCRRVRVVFGYKESC